MAVDDKKAKKPKPLIKLNGNKDELYDSYGYKIEPPKPRPASSHTIDSRKHEQAAGQSPKKPQSEPARRSTNTQGSQKKQTAKSGIKAKDTGKKTNDTGRKAKDAGKKINERQHTGNVPDTKGMPNAKSTAKDKNAPSHERRISARSIRRRKTLLAIGKVGIFVLLAACIIALILHDKSENANTPRTAFLSTGTIENSFSANVNFIRDEQTVTTDFSGKLITAVNEGDRVAAGSIIAYVVKPGYENELKQLREIDSKIAAVQSAAAYVGSSQNTEMSEMNDNIKKLSERLSSLSGTTSGMREYPEIMDELEGVFKIKNEVLVNTDSADEYINTLKTERSATLARLENSMYEVTAKHAGVVSFHIDVSAQNASEKAGTIAEYISKKGQTDNTLAETALLFENTEMKNTINTEVKEGAEVARITPDVTYYMTADITGIDAAGLTSGKKITVKGSAREFTAEATVEEILRYGDKQYMLLKSSSGISGAISKRNVQSDIIVDYSEGIKVPKRALTDWDSAGLTARITIARSNYVSYVFVNILAEDSEYAIISNSNSFGTENDEDISSVRINDLYVVNYETVSDGQILGD